MKIEYIEQQVNLEPVRIMLRNGIVTGQTRTVVYMKKIVCGAKILRRNPDNFASVDSSVFSYSAILEKRSEGRLDSINSDNLGVEDFKLLLKIFE